MSVYYIASLKINYFIAQNLGNKAKPRDHDPPGYFRSQKYPGYEVAKSLSELESTVTRQLSDVHKWLCANKLSLNIEKSSFCKFSLMFYQLRENILLNTLISQLIAI